MILAITSIYESYGIVKIHATTTRSQLIKGFFPNVVFISYFIIMWAFSDLLWVHPAIIYICISPYFCLSLARVIICSLGKKVFDPFEDLHLSMPMFLTLAAFPANKLLGLNMDERYMFAVSLATNLLMYFMYVVNSIN